MMQSQLYLGAPAKTQAVPVGWLHFLQRGSQVCVAAICGSVNEDRCAAQAFCRGHEVDSRKGCGESMLPSVT